LKTVTPNAVVLNAPVRVILPQFCNSTWYEKPRTAEVSGGQKL